LADIAHKDITVAGAKPTSPTTRKVKGITDHLKRTASSPAITGMVKRMSE